MSEKEKEGEFPEYKTTFKQTCQIYFRRVHIHTVISIDVDDDDSLRDGNFSVSEERK